MLVHPIFVLIMVMSMAGVAGCVREQAAPPEREKPAAQRVTPERAPLATHDLTGKPRARPRATMGALEAEPGAESPPSRPRKERRPEREVEG